MNSVLIGLRVLGDAVQNCNPDTTDINNPGSCLTTLPTISASNGSLQIILQLVFAAIGAVALVIVLVASLMFISSRGNPEALNKLRGTLIWAGVGLGVALGAEAIVTFALGSLK